ncbi:non-structural maintenance of chromosome element 4 [Fusarium beomiforme]|uniref:Non-structural maintenance of chromosome element 4 n=1 Tax=Fusarium beomiforme TaxID=44412 RepID=A0A9P5AS05_9HYPO|nr:non-structural maintenance of chromosome element 4 [Fusarium beomiforme]
MPTRTHDSPSHSRSPSQPSRATPAHRNLAVRERESSRSASGAKRKRADTRNGEPASHRRRTVEPTAASDDSDDSDEDEDDVYDPDQPLEERRRVQQGFRDLLREVTENTEEYLQADSRGLHEAILRADELSKKVRQTTEATIDSRLLVSTTDLSYRKTLRLTQGSLSQGLDVDEFVSKCITYMRHGRGIMDDDAPELSSTQRQRRRTTRGDEDGEDDIGDEGDMMNWPHLGRFACLPYIRRPALPGFLLGPLSVEKKARKIAKRSAPFRPNNLTETRPEVLNVEDLAKKENDLTAICGKILHQLQHLQADIQETVADLIDENMDDEQQNRIMHQHGLRSTGGIDLMRFVVNPKSFGQTIENMFYVSFLVRDGRVKIDFDEFDLPALEFIDREVEAEAEEPQRHGAAKHQAILSMDMETWQDIINTFGLEEPMITHRKDVATSGPGARDKMASSDPFQQLSNNTEVRLNENAQKLESSKSELTAQLNQFYNERCSKTKPSLPKMALQILKDYNEKAKSCLGDMFKVFHDMQQNDVNEFKVQIEVLSKQISEQQQGQMARNNTQEILLRQQLYVSHEMEQRKEADSRSSPGHVAAETKQDDLNPTIQTPGSAGKAFEKAFETAQATKRRRRRSNRTQKSKSSSRSDRKAMIKKRPTMFRLESIALASTDSSLDEPQSTPTELVSHDPIISPKLSTAVRLKDESMANPLSQELDTPSLVSDDPDASQSEYVEPKDRLTFVTETTNSLEGELSAAQVVLHPLMEDTLILGDELNEPYSNLLCLSDAKKPDVGNTDGVKALRELEAQNKELKELLDEYEQKIEDLERNSTEHQTYCLKEARHTQSPERLAQPGPCDAVVSPEMRRWLCTALSDNTERLKSAVNSYREMEKEFEGQRSDPNKGSNRELINIWEPASRGHHKDFDKTPAFFTEISDNILEIKHHPGLPQRAAISVPTVTWFTSLSKMTVSASDSGNGGSTLGSGMEGSQVSASTPTRNYGIDDNEYGGIDSNVNAFSELKLPVVVKPAVSSTVGSPPMHNAAPKPWIDMKTRISVPGTGLMSPETTPEMQVDDTESVDSLRGRNPSKKETTSGKGDASETGNAPNDSTPEKKVASEDEKEEESNPVEDMSNDSDLGSSDVPEASQAENTLSSGNDEDGNDPHPTKEGNDDVESCLPPLSSSINHNTLIQWLTGALWSLLPQALLFLVKPILAEVRIFAFLVDLLYHSFIRFTRGRNVGKDRKSLRFPELPEHEDIYAIVYHILFLMTCAVYFDVRHERQLWYSANGQTRELMLGKMGMQQSVIWIAFSYLMGALESYVIPFVFLGRFLERVLLWLFWLVWLIPDYFIQDWKSRQAEFWRVIKGWWLNR